MLSRFIEALKADLHSRRSMQRVNTQFNDNFNGKPVYLWVDGDECYWLAQHRYGRRTKVEEDEDDHYDAS